MSSFLDNMLERLWGDSRIAKALGIEATDSGFVIPLGLSAKRLLNVPLPRRSRYAKQARILRRFLGLRLIITPVA